MTPNVTLCLCSRPLEITSRAIVEVTQKPLKVSPHPVSSWSAFKNDTKASTLDTNTNGKIDPNGDALSKEMIEEDSLL